MISRSSSLSFFSACYEYKIRTGRKREREREREKRMRREREREVLCVVKKMKI